MDGFGNRVTVHAASNPREMGREPKDLHDRMPGYGIVRLNKAARTITFECWPRFANRDKPLTGSQYAGWPVTIQQMDNDGRKPTGHLPEIRVKGLDNPAKKWRRCPANPCRIRKYWY